MNYCITIDTFFTFIALATLNETVFAIRITFTLRTIHNVFLPQRYENYNNLTIPNFFPFSEKELAREGLQTIFSMASAIASGLFASTMIPHSYFFIISLFGINLGGGFDFNFSEDWAFNTELRIMPVFMGVGMLTFTRFMLSAGLVYRF